MSSLPVTAADLDNGTHCQCLRPPLPIPSVSYFVGSGISASRLSHIAELDLTDNLLSKWSEIHLLLQQFSGLEFLNLSNNLLSEPMAGGHGLADLRMRKLVLNGNKIDWASVDGLVRAMPQLDELHLSTNDLGDPGNGAFAHDNLRQLFLGCNPISSFEAVTHNLRVPALELLSLAECPLASVPDLSEDESPIMARLNNLSLSTTKIGSWEEVDKLRNFPSLKELRLQYVPILNELSAHERRMMIVARLPNIQVLNGGDMIPATEREDAERGFIRHFLSSPVRPPRYHELVAVHGQLDPLVNVNMAPDTHVKVTVCHKDAARVEVIKVYQTVQQFKAVLQGWFGMPPQNMKVYYCDKVRCSDYCP